MGITEVECVVVELSEEKEKALNVALNKISGDWDKEKLALLIAICRARILMYPSPALNPPSWMPCLRTV